MDLMWGWIVLLSAALGIATVVMTERRFAGALWAAFGARAALALVHIYAISLTGGEGDAANFMRDALAWSADGFNTAVLNFRSGSRFYSWLLSVFFAATYPSELAALAINVFFGTLVVYNVGRLVLLVTSNRRYAQRAAWFTALYPPLVLFSAMTIREVAVHFPLTLGMLYLAVWWRDGKQSSFYAALISFGISGLFHPGMFAFVGGLGVLAAARWAGALAHSRGTRWVHASGGLVVVACLMAVGIATRAGLYKLGDDLSVEAIAMQQQGAARSRAAYLEGQVPSSPQQLLAQTPIRVVYLLYAPFPWMARTVGDLAGILDALIYLGMSAVILRHRRALWGERAPRALLVVLIVGIIPFAVSTSNYGTALRHRAKFIPAFVALYFASRTLGVSGRLGSWPKASPPSPVPLA